MVRRFELLAFSLEPWASNFEPSVLVCSFSAGGEISSPAEFLEGLSAKIRELFAWGSMEFKISLPIKCIIARPDPLGLERPC